MLTKAAFIFIINTVNTVIIIITRKIYYTLLKQEHTAASAWPKTWFSWTTAGTFMRTVLVRNVLEVGLIHWVVFVTWLRSSSRILSALRLIELLSLSWLPLYLSASRNRAAKETNTYSKQCCHDPSNIISSWKIWRGDRNEVDVEQTSLFSCESVSTEGDQSSLHWPEQNNSSLLSKRKQNV